MTNDKYEVVVIGGGPAGLAAASTASACGRRVALIDDNPAPGGQVWRGDTREAWIERVRASAVQLFFGASVEGLGDGRLYAERDGELLSIRYDRLILATGARERFLPFPGWTLPGVFGAGGLQALAKCGMPVTGRRVVVAGSGPLLVAVAAYLRQHGAQIPLIAEQTSSSRLQDFAETLWRYPGKLIQGAALGFSLLGIPYRTGCWPVAAEGAKRLEAVVVERQGKPERVACDYMACGFGLVPNTELAALLGCRLERGFVEVNEWQETSCAGVYCAGEPTGIGGVDAALVEGQIAGFAASGRATEAGRLFAARRRWKRFQQALDRAFALRNELREIARPDTILCRCEDIPLAAVAGHNSWRFLKLHTRCGMGPCQGRICGPAIEFLRGFPADSVRPPVFPASVANLSGWQQ